MSWRQVSQQITISISYMMEQSCQEVNGLTQSEMPS